jgi:hypothetical protein
MPPKTINEKTRRSNKKMKEISSGMIQLQKPMAAVDEEFLCEESLCEHSVASISKHSFSQESGTGEGTATEHTITSSLNNGNFVKVEELNVRRARRLVGVVFVLCAVAVSIAVFLFAKKSDERAFEVEVRKTLQNLFSRFVSR